MLHEYVTLARKALDRARAVATRSTRPITERAKRNGSQSRQAVKSRGSAREHEVPSAVTANKGLTNPAGCATIIEYALVAKAGRGGKETKSSM